MFVFPFVISVGCQSKQYSWICSPQDCLYLVSLVYTEYITILW